MIIQDENWDLIKITKGGSAVFADQLRFVEQLPNFYDFDVKTPYKDLSNEVKEVFLYGSGKKLPFEWESRTFSGILEREYEGIIPHVERALKESKSAYRRKKAKKFMITKRCEECEGYRINDQAREIKINGKHIGELAMMPIDELSLFLSTMINHIKTQQGKAIINTIIKGLQNMADVGLAYLHLNRTLPTLSGGELQRLSLMTHLDSGIDSLVYVLDEPSMSLHEQEKGSLIEIIKRLKKLGNTIIVVEHDKKFIEIADLIIDIGPGAGKGGGSIVYEGNLEGIKSVDESYTGLILRGKIRLPDKPPESRNTVTESTKFLTLRNVTTNNLKNLTVQIPLEMMVGFAGVSGSGKSSLILDTLVPILKPLFSRSTRGKKKHKNEEEDDNGEQLMEYHGKIDGWENIDEVIVVNQKPISRVRTSTPCSYIGIWDKIRRVFAKNNRSKEKKYSPGHFSYNSEKGRCPVCKGTGEQDLQISFLSSFNIPCRECHGLRYKPEILDVKYKGKNISEILNMTVTEALEHFETHTSITKVLKILDDIGMGYITLGQPAPTLSGGEAQRVKLAKELGKTRKKHSLYILDEPTVGLSFYDAVKLMELLNKLVLEGNSVFIIEHDPDILSYCDYLIELGPEGGPKGGEIIATGTPSEIIKNKSSNTGAYLK